jgi:restriction endonuclease S subunit
MAERALKTGWTWVKFGDVVRQVKDKVDARASGLKRYIGGEHMDTDDLHIRRWGEITDDYLGPAFHMRFKPGQVLYGSRRTYLRKVAVPDFEGICANTTFVLESKDPTMLLPELLPFIMQTEVFHEYSITNSKGSVNPYINFSDLAEYEFALPPLAEQRRIMEVLLVSAEALESYRNLVHITNQQYLSLILHIFQKGVTKQKTCQYKHFRYPAHWVLYRVDDCYDLQLGKMSSAKARKGPSQKLYLKNNNVLWGEFDFSNLSSMSFNAQEQKKFSRKRSGGIPHRILSNF